MWNCFLNTVFISQGPHGASCSQCLADQKTYRLVTSTAGDLLINQFVLKLEQNSKCNVNCLWYYMFGSMLKSVSALLVPYHLYHITIESWGAPKVQENYLPYLRRRTCSISTCNTMPELCRQNILVREKEQRTISCKTSQTCTIGRYR